MMSVNFSNSDSLARPAAPLPMCGTPTLPPSQVMDTAVDLSSVFNNRGIASDADAATGNFDGFHDSYSAQTLKGAGFAPGADVFTCGMLFAWPKSTTGPTDVIAQGQTIVLPKPAAGTALGILGAANSNEGSGTIEVSYSDGTVFGAAFKLSDWSLNGGQSPVATGDLVAANLLYHDAQSGPSSPQNTYLFFTKVPLRVHARVTRLRLPAASSFAPLHIFAMTVGVPVTSAAVPGISNPAASGFAGALGFASLGTATISATTALLYPGGTDSVKSLGTYTNWSDAGANGWPFVRAQMDSQLAAGSLPVLSWDSSGASACDLCISKGQEQTYVDEWARHLKSLPYDVVIRLDWEMNGWWYAYSPGQHHNTAASFIAMWRYVHDRLASDGVTNVRWFWCPNSLDGANSFAADYPGDAYVDFVGVDVYNWGTFHTWTHWETVTQLLTASYALLNKVTSTKPIVLGEVASCDAPYNKGATGPTGTKAGWITSAFLTEIPQNFPRVAGFMWFNEDKAPAECNFRIDSDPAARAAFVQVAASPLWQATFPQ